jgi:hypothetical protein
MWSECICWTWVWSRLDWVWCHHVDSTESTFLDRTQTLHEDIPLLSPTCTPRVLNYPVLVARGSSIAHQKNPMIQVRPAFTCEYTLQYIHTMLQEDERKNLREIWERSNASGVLGQLDTTYNIFRTTEIFKFLFCFFLHKYLFWRKLENLMEYFEKYMTCQNGILKMN